MDLRHHIEKLEVFVAVAKAGSFRAASERIHISQPSISHAMQVLEKSVGSQLFIRNQRGVELTRAGSELLRFSERLMIEVESVEKRIQQPDSELVGTLSLGTFSSLISYLWSPFLLHLSTGLGHQISVRLHSLKGEDVEGALRSRRHHLIVSSVNVQMQDAINFELYSDSYGFFRSKKQKGAFSKAPLIYVPAATDVGGLALEKILRQAEIQSEKTYHVDTFEAAASLANEGLGLAVLPIRVAAHLGLTQISEEGAYAKTYGRHAIYGSMLAIDRSDPLLMFITKELKIWTSKIR